MPNKPRSLSRRPKRGWWLVLAVAGLLPQASCSVDALTQAFTNELINSSTQFTFDVTQTILANLFQL